MTAAFLPPQAIAAAPRPLGGRPRTADDPAQVRSRIRYAALVLSGALLVKQAASAAGVSRQTIWRWVNESLASDEPEAEGLRRLVGRARARTEVIDAIQDRPQAAPK